LARRGLQQIHFGSYPQTRVAEGGDPERPANALQALDLKKAVLARAIHIEEPRYDSTRLGDADRACKIVDQKRAGRRAGRQDAGQCQSCAESP
jgi:hypothetical protein